MKAYISDERKVVYVDPDDDGPAFPEGWIIDLRPRPLGLAGRKVDVIGISTLADAVREGPPCTHSCPRHPKREATG